MASISFTSNIQRHVNCPDGRIEADTLHDLLHGYFAQHPAVQHYVLDDQGELRKHMVIFIDGEQARDRQAFTDRLGNTSEVYVFQALSGG